MPEQGVVMTMVTWGTNMTEKTMALPLGTARTVRDEFFRATFAGVDWVEGVSHSYFKIVRELLQRVDKLSQETFDGLDSMAGSVSRVIRGSGEAAGEMVSKTAASLTGTNERSPKAMTAASA